MMGWTHKSWAIDPRSTEGHGLLGVYGWYDGKPPSIPPQCMGCKTALFDTRKVARAYLPAVHKTWPRARVVRVTVEISA